MPELPEVETTRRGLLPHLVGRTFSGAVVRNASLRWPVSRGLARSVRGEEVLDIRRRGKYVLIDSPNGHLLVHLGMSGRLSIVDRSEPPRAHDHVDVLIEADKSLRLTDPRRFGAMLWLKWGGFCALARCWFIVGRRIAIMMYSVHCGMSGILL